VRRRDLERELNNNSNLYCNRFANIDSLEYDPGAVTPSAISALNSDDDDDLDYKPKKPIFKARELMISTKNLDPTVDL
jgi:hypothetical protein